VAPEPVRLALVGRALLGSCVGVLSSVVLSLLCLEGSYAGVQDDGTTEQAVATFRPFLESIGRQLAWLGLLQALCFMPAVLGLLLLLRVHWRLHSSLQQRLHLCSRGWAQGVLVSSLSGLLVVFAFGAGVAHRHPGLFLSLLASSHWLTWCARFGHVLVVLVFGAAALGYVFTALRPRQSWRVAVGCGLTLLLPLGVWIAALLLPGPARIFGHQGAQAASQSEKIDQPNVLVLAVDSLRPDLIDAQRTPHLQRLLAESVYFPNALVTQPRTGPSWAAA
jgi:hypothetical protein